MARSSLTRQSSGHSTAAQSPRQGRWSEAATAELIERWNAGESSVAIGRSMGCSHSKIVAKLKRLRERGVVLRPPTKSPPAVGRNHKSSPPDRKRARAREAKRKPSTNTPLARSGTEAAAKPKPGAPVKVPPLPEGIGIDDILLLERHHCRWIEGDPGRGRVRWCAEPAVPGTSWCRAHLEIVWAPPLPKRKLPPAEFAPEPAEEQARNSQRLEEAEA